ncbi:hypothetical protein TorRG33x02_125080 [Trema orientale]|uniref:Uncharacterized protein n=1 Tax=Trema orientale TaxID=63057 RepID=A0A2P5F1L1_TREOI|nr:hypothetical protein TorRG33x02_125080 [Trema orientale]
MGNEKEEGRLKLIQRSGGRENWRVEKSRAIAAATYRERVRVRVSVSQYF